MGKIISLNSTVDTSVESVVEIEEVFFIETEQVVIPPIATGLTAAGYDEEIGLWEELWGRGIRGNINTR